MGAGEVVPVPYWEHLHGLTVSLSHMLALFQNLMSCLCSQYFKGLKK